MPDDPGPCIHRTGISIVAGIHALPAFMSITTYSDHEETDADTHVHDGPDKFGNIDVTCRTLTRHALLPSRSTPESPRLYPGDDRGHAPATKRSPPPRSFLNRAALALVRQPHVRQVRRVRDRSHRKEVKSTQYPSSRDSTRTGDCTRGLGAGCVVRLGQSKTPGRLTTNGWVGRRRGLRGRRAGLRRRPYASCGRGRRDDGWRALESGAARDGPVDGLPAP